MRRLSTSQRLGNDRHANQSWKRQLTSKQKLRSRRRQVLQELIARKSKDRPRLRPKKKGTETIHIPSTLSFDRNPEETFQFFREFREVILNRKKRCKIDFTSLKDISSAAALVLTAEIDRWRRLYGFRPVVHDFHKWYPPIKRLLFEMGMFEVLEVSNMPPREVILRQGVEIKSRFVKFRTGDVAEGIVCQKLRLNIEEMIDGDVDRAKLYGAITEAMTNVKNHAYPEDLIEEDTILRNRWWVSAAYFADRKTIHVIFYDQGVGIPATVPLHGKRELLIDYLSKIGLVDGDAERIQAAVEMGRSQTKKSYRGKGLVRNIRRFVEDSQGGQLRILSGSGGYIYYSDGRIVLTKSPESLGGTLIQWEAIVE